MRRRPAPTFVENALLKARHAARVSGLPAIADDSGLEVDALGGAPGCPLGALRRRTAASDATTIASCCDELRPCRRRRAARVIAVRSCSCAGRRRSAAADRAKAAGRAASCRAPRGSDGFGYDPLFDVRRDTDARPRETRRRPRRTRISHRGQALRGVAARAAGDRETSDERRRSRSTSTCPGACASARTATSTRTQLRRRRAARGRATSMRCSPTSSTSLPRVLGPAACITRVLRRRHAEPVLAGGDRARCWRAARACCRSRPAVEITLEANPGTVERGAFAAIARPASTGCRSARRASTTRSSRRSAASTTAARRVRAVDELRGAGFDNFNLDLMYALPDRRSPGARRRPRARARARARAPLALPADARAEHACSRSRPPPLPDDDRAVRDAGRICQRALADAGLRAIRGLGAMRARGAQCRHNLNYWEFGDYLGHRRRRARQAHARRTRHAHGAPTVAVRYMAAATPAERIAEEQRSRAPRAAVRVLLNALRLGTASTSERLKRVRRYPGPPSSPAARQRASGDCSSSRATVGCPRRWDAAF